MSRIIAHYVRDGDTFCTICGTTQIQITAGYGCIWRDVPDARMAKTMPEPKERVYASEDWDGIGISMKRIKYEETPMCPINAGRSLYDCLRSSAMCVGHCPHKDDWMGPDGTAGHSC
jgi:hypothetical protein